MLNGWLQYNVAALHHEPVTKVWSNPLRHAKPTCQLTCIVCNVWFDWLIQPPHKIIEFEVQLLADIWCLPSNFFISGSMITSMGHSWQQFAFIHETKVLEMLWYLFLCCSQPPALCQCPSLLFSCMVLILAPLLWGVLHYLHLAWLLNEFSVSPHKFCHSMNICDEPF